MHSTSDLTGCEESLDANRCRCIRIDLDATHDVVTGRADLHRFLGDIDISEFLELVPHRRKTTLDLLSGKALRDI